MLTEPRIRVNQRTVQTQALELDHRVVLGKPAYPRDQAHLLALKSFFDSVCLRLDPDRSAENHATAVFRCRDTKESLTVYVRQGVAEVREGSAEKSDLLITVDWPVWKELLTGLRSPFAAYAREKIDVQGGNTNLARFLRLFGN
jgi:alkyl sulfatase BDS1-like metallo-beta-lactamase superfamily hydrolase